MDFSSVYKTPSCHCSDTSLTEKFVKGLRYNQWVSLSSKDYGEIVLEEELDYEEYELKMSERAKERGNVFAGLILNAKTEGLFCSKGDWLSHECGGGSKIITFEVDYEKILCVTTEEELDFFRKHYFKKFSIDWIKVKQDYCGFVLLPSNFNYGRNNNCNYGRNNNCNWMCGYDVSTLIIWNDDCVLKSTSMDYDISTISEKTESKIGNLRLEETESKIGNLRLEETESKIEDSEEDEFDDVKINTLLLKISES